MANRLQPEILPPSSASFPGPAGVHAPGLRSRARDLVSDENLDLLAHLLDDCFRIPGTNFRLGIDGLIGLIPGLGDVLAGLASCLLILAAWIRGVPYVTLARMTVNVGIEVLIGSVPIFGDLFDIAFKANRRNYRLLTRHLRQPHQHTWRDWTFLLGLAAAILLILATPVVVFLLLVVWALHRL